MKNNVLRKTFGNWIESEAYKNTNHFPLHCKGGTGGQSPPEHNATEVKMWESSFVSTLELGKNFLFHGLHCHSSFWGSFYFIEGSLIVFISYPLDEPSPGELNVVRCVRAGKKRQCGDLQKASLEQRCLEWRNACPRHYICSVLRLIVQEGALQSWRGHRREQEERKTLKK